MYEPYHGIHDQSKYEALVQSIGTHRYQGVPLLADGDCLITGSHRWAACKELGITPPVIDIRDIFPEFDEYMAEFDFPAIGDRLYAIAIDGLPESLKAEYGIDIH